MMAICRKCSCEFEISAAALRKCNYICKPCRAIQTRANYERRKAVGLRVSGQNLGRDYHRAYAAKYSQKPDVRKRRAEKAKQRIRNPLERHKHEARWQARRAIVSGKLIRQPCEVCGAIKVDAHHDDYAKPLDVRWLCRIHHNEHHHTHARGDLVDPLERVKP